MEEISKVKYNKGDREILVFQNVHTGESEE